MNGQYLPYADDIMVIVTETKVVLGNESFIIEKILEYSSSILAVKYCNGMQYVITKTGVYLDKNLMSPVSAAELCSVIGSEPVMVIRDGTDIIFQTFKKVNLGRIRADDLMELNGFIYSVFNGRLIENGCIMFGNNLVHHTLDVCGIFQSYQMFKGVVIQDVLGCCHFAIPYKQKTCINIHVKELDSFRIISAKYEQRFCVVLAEKKR